MKLDGDAQSVDEAPVGMEFARAVSFARISSSFLCVTHSNCNGVAVSVGWLIKVSFGLLASGPPFTKAGDEGCCTNSTCNCESWLSEAKLPAPPCAGRMGEGGSAASCSSTHLGCDLAGCGLPHPFSQHT